MDVRRTNLKQLCDAIVSIILLNVCQISKDVLKATVYLLYFVDKLYLRAINSPKCRLRVRVGTFTSQG